MALALGGCSHRHHLGPGVSSSGSRSYRMGFSGIPPRPELAQVIATIDLWAPRADAALMSGELPWDSLLAGRPPDSVVFRNMLPLAQYYRAKGLRIVVMIDPANGLDRAGESNELVAAGHSITEPAIQQLYRRYMVAIDSIIRPDQLGFALETNLIRAIAPPTLYQALRQMANDAASDVHAVDPLRTLMVSVQVDAAWGRLLPAPAYVGVGQDFADFPFLQVLGLSSYPYLAGFAQPEDLPGDYYSRLIEGHSVPVMVTEGGWSSVTVSSTVTSPAMQRRYIVRQALLLEGMPALALFQLTFTDLDLTVWTPGVAPFAYLGLVDVDLHPKPALAPWDSLFALPRH